MAAMSTPILAVAVSDPLVTAYRFEISDGNTVRTYTTSDGATNYFKLKPIIRRVSYNTTYTIQWLLNIMDYGNRLVVHVRLLHHLKIPLKVVTSQCGITVRTSTRVYSEMQVFWQMISFELTSRFRNCFSL